MKRKLRRYVVTSLCCKGLVNILFTIVKCAKIHKQIQILFSRSAVHAGVDLRHCNFFHVFLLRKKIKDPCKKMNKQSGRIHAKFENFNALAILLKKSFEKY